MPAPGATSGDDIGEHLRVVESQMASAIYAGKLSRDPTTATLEAMRDLTRVMVLVMRRVEAAGQVVISDQELDRIWTYARRRARQDPWLLVVRENLWPLALSAAAGLVALLLVAIGSYALGGGFRAPVCQEQWGGEVCFPGKPVWTRPPTQAQNAAKGGSR
jgi:hypothetical protein